jgi:hypothetical protein
MAADLDALLADTAGVLVTFLGLPEGKTTATTLPGAFVRSGRKSRRWSCVVASSLVRLVTA